MRKPWLLFLLVLACAPAKKTGGVIITGSVAGPQAGLTRQGADVGIADVNALLCRVNDDGTLEPTPVAQAKTDAQGQFRIDAPAGTELSVQLLVQATSGTACSPVTSGAARQMGGNNLNCPAVQTPLPIDPASEIATRSIFRTVRARGTGFSGFSTSEVSSFVAVAQSLRGSAGGSTLTEVLANLEQTIGPAVDAAALAIAQPGETSAPPPLVGDFRWHALFLGNRDTSLSRAANSGAVTLGTGGAWTLNANERSRSVSINCSSCGAEGVLGSTSTQAVSASGTFRGIGNGQVLFSGPDQSLVGIVDPSANVVMLPFIRANGDLGLGIAVKKGTQGTASGAFDSFMYNSSVNGGNAGGPVTIQTSQRVATVGSGMLAVSGGVEDPMAIDYPGCGVCSGASLRPMGMLYNGFQTPLTVAQDGGFSVQQQGGDPLSGTLGAGGQLVLMQAGGDAGILLGVKQSTSAPNIDGRYSILAIGEQVTTNGNHAAQLVSGVITIAGTAAQADFVLASSTFKARCSVSNDMASCAAAEARTTTASVNGNVLLAADGKVSISFAGLGASFVLIGTFAPDGTLAVLTRRLVSEADAGGFRAERMIGLALKQ